MFSGFCHSKTTANLVLSFQRQHGALEHEPYCFGQTYSKSRVVETYSTAHMTCLWPKVTHSPDCIATVSIWLGWQWRTEAWETMAYLTQADIANLGSIRGSLISAHGTAGSFLLPHGQIRHNADPERGHKFKFFTVTEIRITLNCSVAPNIKVPPAVLFQIYYIYSIYA